MIAKYNGHCTICGLPTQAQKDHYDVTTKENWHAACREAQPGAGQFELAERLGWLKHDCAMATDWPLFLLSGIAREPAKRRQPQACGLFETIRSVSASDEE